MTKLVLAPIATLGVLGVLGALAGCPKGSDHKQPADPVAPENAGSAGSAGRRLLPNDAAGSAAALVLAPAAPLPQPPLGLPPPPAAALAEVTPEALALGELVFWDGRLAANGSISCAGCHDPAHGYESVTGAGDHRVVAPTLVNAAWRAAGTSFAADLAAHARQVLGNDLAAAATRLAEVPLYRAHLERIGGAPGEALAKALEAYVVTRYAGDSPWDRKEHTLGSSLAAARDPEVVGYRLFTSLAQCAICHTPPLYSDLRAHGGHLTPTLRGASARPGYFHDAHATSLEQALQTHPATVPALPAISANDRAFLLAFLRALGTTAPPPAKPILP